MRRISYILTIIWGAFSFLLNGLMLNGIISIDVSIGGAAVTGLILFFIIAKIEKTEMSLRAP